MRNFTAIGVLLLLPAPLLAVPAIHFEAQAVVVSGITPKGQVVWFSQAREFSQGVATMVRREKIAADSDGSGVVRFPLDRPVPALSVWVAVDLANGAAAAASPDGLPQRQLPLLDSGVIARGRALGDQIVDHRGFVELLVVRPGKGAWGATVGEGSDRDEAATRGTLAASLARMRPLAASPAAPSAFSAGDVVVVIDPNLLTYSVVKVGGGAK
ncbi:MAG TPA: hypothetical protein VHR45_00655 [Thermoanaerobaculia bacterium]|nr:hypothetical protein [Thermoanaerobaculia bacterium]